MPDYAMTALKNDRFLRALLKQPVDVTPVWMMRQAGRYLPEYRATRAQAGNFVNLMKNPELACEVTIQPLDRYPQLDAAILFSDILTIPDAMGQGLYFETGEGPRFQKVVSSLADIEALPIPDAEQDLGYVMDAVRTIRRELNGRVPLIGFSGSPWTLATYMVEGGSSKDFRKSKAMLYNNPQAMHALLDKLARSVTAYLNGQILAGAQAVQIFDSWGGAASRSRRPSCTGTVRSASPCSMATGASTRPMRASESNDSVVSFAPSAPQKPAASATSGRRVNVDSSASAARSRPRRSSAPSATATAPPIEWPKTTRRAGSGCRRVSSPQACQASAMMLCSVGTIGELSPQPR
jgi:hypothetical protein